MKQTWSQGYKFFKSLMWGATWGPNAEIARGVFDSAGDTFANTKSPRAGLTLWQAVKRPPNRILSSLLAEAYFWTAAAVVVRRNADEAINWSIKFHDVPAHNLPTSETFLTRE